MPRPNAGGGRYNQNSDIQNLPRRALFSNFSLASGSKGGKGGKGGKGDGDGKGKKAPRPHFNSQKEMDKWKAAQKGAAAAKDQHPNNGKSDAGSASASGCVPGSIWQNTSQPSSVHGVLCLTRDDHLAMEPLLDPCTNAPPPTAGIEDELPGDVRDEAAEHLLVLGFPPARIRTAMQVVAPPLMREAEDRDTFVTPKAVAERALEWLCSVTEEDALPSRLRESREVATARKRQEERNVVFQSRALLLGGDLDSTHIARIEKLGFSRAKAIEALAKAPGHQLVPAVRGLMSGYLPLEAGDDAWEMASSPEDLAVEAEAMQGAYGEDAVHTLQHAGNFEINVAVPETEWNLVMLIPEGLPYPSVAPLLCPRHPRLREAGRPRLLTALGEVCRSALGTPMFLTLSEWLREDGERFLVRATCSGAEAGSKAGDLQPSVSAAYRSLAASEEQRQREEEAAQERDRRCAYLKALQEEEQKASQEAARCKDKLAQEIRDDPGSSKQYDLEGYSEARVKELVREAFGAPLEVDKPVRITFIIGGGKAVRQKYSDSLGRELGNALQEHGFTQDSTASLTAESAGTFKGQHDTQRNLKLVHVFPHFAAPKATTVSVVNETAEQAHKRIACAPWEDFVEEVTPWTRSRDLRPKAEALLPYLQDAATELEKVDRMLQAGQKVTDAQRCLYDELGGAEEVGEKARWLIAALSSKPRAGREQAGGGGMADGSTFSVDAPDRLAQAARLAELASGVAGAADESQDSDEAQLRRRVRQTRTESDRLKADFARDKPLKETRESLPAWSVREEIQEATRNQQVIVIEGDTGCGKSTQVPQFILEDWVSRGEGGAVNLIMTQPRRISAIGVAERVAAEVDAPLGDLVGYSIRLESKRSQRTKVLVCTTGVLLRRLESDRSLRGVTHIVVDECHERDLDTDFLLIVLRDLLPSRPMLKVILMSATINAQIFRDYFGDCRSIHIPGRTFPVTSYYLEHALEHTGFVVEPDSQYSKRDVEQLSYHDEAELRAVYEREEYWQLMDGVVPSYRVLDNMERMDPEKINFDLVAAVVRHIHHRVDPPSQRSGKPPGAILVFVPGLGEIKKTIAALGAEDGGGRWGGSQGYDDDGGKKGGKGKGNGGKSTVGGVSGGLWVLPLHSMISVQDQRRVFQRPERGLRKVVVTTNIAETSITIDDVEYVVDCGRHKQTKYDPQNRISMLVDCVETKANAKQRRGRAGRVKAGVCYHLVNVRKWRRMDDFEKPEMLRVPLDSLCLRISLLGLGHPARFLAKALTPPTDAAVRSSLQQLVELSAVELKQKRATPSADNGTAEAEAEAELGSAGWNKDEQDRLLRAKLRLTPLGTHLAHLPVDAGIGKLLVLGCLFGIPRDVCVLAAALSTKSPFQAVVSDKKKDVDKLKLDLSKGLESDHLLLVSLFERWESLGKKSHEARAWCRQNQLDSHTFETVAEMRAHLLGVLVEQGFTTRDQADVKMGSSDTTSGPWMPPCLSCIKSAGEEFGRRKQQLMRALLCAAMWPNVMLRKPEGQLYARNQASLSFHPSSVLAVQEEKLKEEQAGDWNCLECGFYNFGSREVCKNCGSSRPPPTQTKAKQLKHRAFMFSEKTRTVASHSGGRTMTYARDCCGVSLKAVALLGHRLAVNFLSGHASVDGWIHCTVAPRDAAMLLGLRRRLQDVLSRMLSRQGDAQSRPPNGEDPEVIDAVTSLLVLDCES